MRLLLSSIGRSWPPVRSDHSADARRSQTPTHPRVKAFTGAVSRYFAPTTMSRNRRGNNAERQVEDSAATFVSDP